MLSALRPITFFPTVSPAHEVDEALDGTLWVLDFTAGLVMHYTKGGALLGSFPTVPVTAGLAVDPDGDVWVTRVTLGRIRRYASDGTILDKFSAGSSPRFVTIPKGTLGVRYCGPATPHSGGTSARLLVLGSDGGAFVPPGSQGTLCMACTTPACPIGRFNEPSQIIQGPTGSLTVDLNALPTMPVMAVQPGATWRFQCWFRDGATSHFADAVSVTFR
ncbi:MAG: hypothetical protein GY711_07670 [bacterium]|nr:hypothetical protein [bacterium]